MCSYVSNVGVHMYFAQQCQTRVTPSSFWHYSENSICTSLWCWFSSPGWCCGNLFRFNLCIKWTITRAIVVEWFSVARLLLNCSSVTPQIGWIGINKELYLFYFEGLFRNNQKKFDTSTKMENSVVKKSIRAVYFVVCALDKEMDTWYSWHDPI